jgi:hypothetical protein
MSATRSVPFDKPHNGIAIASFQWKEAGQEYNFLERAALPLTKGLGCRAASR